MKMARQQMFLEAQIKSQSVQLGDHEQRLELIEHQFNDPKHHITPEQASQISQAVKAIAMTLTKRSGHNEYGGVYGELYRKFGITGYKLLPANEFDTAITFLTDWHETISGDVPF